FVAEVSRKYESVAGTSAGPCGRCGCRLGHRAAGGTRGRVKRIGCGQIGENRAGRGGILREVPTRMCVIAGKSKGDRLLRGGVAHDRGGIAVPEEGGRYCDVAVGKGEVLEVNGIVRP